MKYALYSQVALTEDMAEYGLKRGEVATVVEHYPMEDEEDGYSLEGLDVPHVTLEVPESKIMSVLSSEQTERIVAKLQMLSATRLLQLNEYVDFLVQKEASEQTSA